MERSSSMRKNPFDKVGHWTDEAIKVGKTNSRLPGVVFLVLSWAISLKLRNENGNEHCDRFWLYKYYFAKYLN